MHYGLSRYKVDSNLEGKNVYDIVWTTHYTFVPNNILFGVAWNLTGLYTTGSLSDPPSLHWGAGGGKCENLALPATTLIQKYKYKYLMPPHWGAGAQSVL